MAKRSVEEMIRDPGCSDQDVEEAAIEATVLDERNLLFQEGLTRGDLEANQRMFRRIVLSRKALIDQHRPGLWDHLRRE